MGDGLLVIETVEQLVALADAARDTFEEAERELLARMTPERCRQVRALRIGPDGQVWGSWRYVAGECWDAWSVAWVRCGCCEDYVCQVHLGQHVHDCPCQPIESWERSPYEPGAIGLWQPPTNQLWGMALCKLAALAHGEDYKAPPWN